MDASQGGYFRRVAKEGARAMSGENLSTIQHVLNHSSLQHKAAYARLDTSAVLDATTRNMARMLGAVVPTSPFMSPPASTPLQEYGQDDWSG